MDTLPNAQQALPFMEYSYALEQPTTLYDQGAQLSHWITFNDRAVSLPVMGGKSYFNVDKNELPSNFKNYGSVWAQHTGQVTYFTPSIDIAPCYMGVYIKFYDNFVPQSVRVLLNNSADKTPIILQDWTKISYKNGEFEPAILVYKTTNLRRNVSYWVEVEYQNTINKSPGFYGQDGILGFNAKYWWSITEVPVSDVYKTATKTYIK